MARRINICPSYFRNFGEQGAKTELKYDFGKRKITMIETILETENATSFNC